MNAIRLDDETAARLGIEVGRFHLTFFVACALIIEVMVAFSGLMMPNLVWLLLGSDNARVLPGSALAGAVFLILADAGARVTMAPEDLPLGVLIGQISGVFFIVMKAKRR